MHESRHLHSCFHEPSCFFERSHRLALCAYQRPPGAVCPSIRALRQCRSRRYVLLKHRFHCYRVAILPLTSHVQKLVFDKHDRFPQLVITRRASVSVFTRRAIVRGEHRRFRFCLKISPMGWSTMRACLLEPSSKSATKVCCSKSIVTPVYKKLTHHQATTIRRKSRNDTRPPKMVHTLASISALRCSAISALRMPKAILDSYMVWYAAIVM